MVTYVIYYQSIPKEIGGRYSGEKIRLMRKGSRLRIPHTNVFFVVEQSSEKAIETIIVVKFIPQLRVQQTRWIGGHK